LLKMRLSASRERSQPGKEKAEDLNFCLHCHGREKVRMGEMREGELGRWGERICLVIESLGH